MKNQKVLKLVISFRIILALLILSSLNSQCELLLQVRTNFWSRVGFSKAAFLFFRSTILCWRYWKIKCRPNCYLFCDFSLNFTMKARNIFSSLSTLYWYVRVRYLKLFFLLSLSFFFLYNKVNILFVVWLIFLQLFNIFFLFHIFYVLFSTVPFSIVLVTC